ncbi:RF-1 domain-containing protein [Dipodascopsis tothii]|uniref:RF-1 domain-containing protein n=1 Tax=Dipodascopsis tothii TaxID=44089 RepID=UPI0034CED791
MLVRFTGRASAGLLLAVPRLLGTGSAGAVGRGWSTPRAAATRPLSLTTALAKKASHLPPRPAINEDEIEEVFIKGGGNGGQKINKTNSKVQLRHVPTGLIVESQATRSREQNRRIARRKMAEELQFRENPDESYRGKKIDLLKRRKANQVKKANRRKRERENEREGGSGEAGGDEAGGAEAAGGENNGRP